MNIEIGVNDIKELYPTIESIKEHIYLRVGNSSSDKKSISFATGLKEIVLIPYIDASKSIDDDNYIAIIIITEGVLEALYGEDISKKEIYELGIKNTLRDFGPINMLDFLDGTCDEAFLLGFAERDRPFKCYTSKAGINGATVAFLPGVLQNISEEFNDDLYISFTSKHEFMVSPANSFIPKDLKEILNYAIDTATLPEDILSKEVYYYDRITDKLTEV